MVTILNQKIEQYIRQLAPERPAFMLEMEKYASENYVSIVPPEAAQFLTFLICITETKHVLEIGTAIAYSTIWLAKSLPDDGHVTTIEINERRYQTATKNIEMAGLKDKISVIKGHAIEVLPEVGGIFDLIFIDAAKGQYEWFFDQLYTRLRPGGLFVFDNVLSQGQVVMADEEIERRQRTSIRKLRDFVKVMSKRTDMVTTLIPIGDGICVSWKK